MRPRSGYGSIEPLRVTVQAPCPTSPLGRGQLVAGVEGVVRKAKWSDCSASGGADSPSAPDDGAIYLSKTAYRIHGSDGVSSGCAFCAHSKPPDFSVRAAARLRNIGCTASNRCLSRPSPGCFRIAITEGSGTLDKPDGSFTALSESSRCGKRHGPASDKCGAVPQGKALVFSAKARLARRWVARPIPGISHVGPRCRH